MHTGAMPNLTLTPDLTDLLPTVAAYHASNQPPEQEVLLAEEIELTRNMVAKRRRDFSHGRQCAREALRLLGEPPTAVLVGHNREPLWPKGITGSISHTGPTAIAAVAHKAELTSLGIDIEFAEPLDRDIIGMVQRDDETDWSTGSDMKILFSIKESIYKCIYPLLHIFVDFQDMQVIRSDDNASFTAIAHNSAIDQDLIAKLSGRYRLNNSFVISSAWID
jgi:4'-phosphopantetheinyl transferase EntD